MTGGFDDGKRYWAAVLAIVALATWWHGPALTAGYLLDDHAQVAMLKGEYPVPRQPWDLYTFSTGDPAETRALMATGFYPWWSHPQVRLSMFRPLASLSRALDLWLFGDAPLAAHLHGLAHWWALLLALAAVYRRLLPAGTALVALLVFGLDQAHPISLAWLANRGSILSALFGCLALARYLRMRDTQDASPLPTALAFGLALAAGEYALCMLGFFVAYEWLGRGDPWPHKLRVLGATLLPACIVFLSARYLTGGGARHSGVYVDPLHEPAAFLTALWQRYPVLLADGLLTLRAEHWSFGAPWTGALIDAGWLPDAARLDYGPWRRVQHGLGVAALGLGLGGVASAARLARRTEASGHVVWLGMGALLSALPVAASLPGSRLLLIPAIGFAPLIATLVTGLTARSPSPSPSVTGRLLGFGRVLACLGLALLHLGIEPLQARGEAVLLAELPGRVEAAVRQAPLDEQLAGAALLGSDDPTLLIYMGMIRRRARLSSPACIWALSGNRFPYRLTRIGAQTLEASYPPGSGQLTEPFERMFRSPSDPLEAGDQVRLPGLTVDVLETRQVGLEGEQHALSRVKFTFAPPLDPPGVAGGVRMLLPTANGIRPLAPPALSKHLDLPSPATPLPVR